MARIFDRNMFIMLFSIMVGVIIITFFVADIMARTSTEEKLTTIHTAEIKEIEYKNLNFTSAFLDALDSLDYAREFKSKGDIDYKVAKEFYTFALSLTDESYLEDYKTIIINSCRQSLKNYGYSQLNYHGSIEDFIFAKNYTNYYAYNDLVDLYVNLSSIGNNLTLIKYRATNLLMEIAENLTYEDVSVNYSENIESLIDLLNSSEYLMDLEQQNYNQYITEINQYELYEKIR